MKQENLAMLCDFYELTMGNGYFQSGLADKIVYFDLFFRTVPDKGGFAIAAGLEQVVEYVKDLHFDQEDIDFLPSRKGRRCFRESRLSSFALLPSRRSWWRHFCFCPLTTSR